MIDLSTKYLGLSLKNPLIAASSGLTGNIESIKKLESSGIAAVVLKSIFEEEILQQENLLASEAEEDKMIYSQLSETLDYVDMHVKEDSLNAYLDLIREAKDQTLIPIIASINCITSYEWTDFAKRIEQSGADALELNVFLNPTDDTDKNFEDTYVEIATKVVSKVSIPVSLKISQYFTKPANVIKRLDKTGIAGIALFNRFFTPDINIDKMEITQASQYSSELDYSNVLRWVALMSKKVKCDLAATTGIHSAETVLKQLMAGAKAVQIASVLYKEGIEYTIEILKDLENWMERKNFNHLSQLQGKLSQESIKDPAAYERMQFMRYFSEME